MKRLLLFFSFLTVAFGVNADDGGARNVEDWTYGNIYVKEPNDKIALEKELMVCGMDSITAVFVFKNTTDDTVTVDCAFPVDSKNWDEESFSFSLVSVKRENKFITR